MKNISIVIPSYNSAKTLEFTLASLDRQTRRDLIREILIVDSSDAPETPELRARCEARGAVWIEAGRRTMPALARNIGAERAQGDVLVFVDSDAYLSEDWIERVAEYVERGCLAGGGSIVLPEFQKFRLIPWAQYFLQFNEYTQEGEARTKPFLPSCNMFCERELFFKCGGFPRLRAAEDVMFFLKAGQLAPIWFVPEARAFHIFRESWSSFLRNQKLLGEYIIAYRRIHWVDKFYYKGLWPILFLPAFAFIKWCRMTARILSARPGLVLGYAASFPLVMVGLFYWSLGFIHGSLR